MAKQLPTKFLGITKPMPDRMATCPACGTKDLIRKTRDVSSPILGDVNCPACGYNKTKQEFMEIDWSNYKKNFK